MESARRPNLASQCLALSLRTLADEFEARHGFQPLLAESFHDPEEHTGTLYKATNWLPLGFTKGYKRHRRDFYQDTGKPKHLWVRPLKKDALTLLARSGLLPPAHQAAIAHGDTAGARCALKCAELRTLRHALTGLTDTRNPKSRRHPLSAMLGLLVYGLICGAQDVKAIWQKCAPLDQNQRRAIGLTQKNKKTGLLTMPGYGALNNGDELKSETRYFITSLEQDARSASRLGEAIRGHWSVENKNHWKRDTSQWKEDATRPRKKASGGQVLALLRGAVLRLHDKEAFATLNASFHHHSARPYAGLRLLKTPPPKIN